MIQGLISASSFLAAVASALAAYHWYRASQVEDPPRALEGYSGFYSGKGPNAGVDASPLIKYAQESSKRNKTAALWSAAAAFFAGLAWVLGLFVAHA